MLIQFQEQVVQLTQHIRDLILQGPDITAFYILEARLTLLATYLRPTSLLTHIFCPRSLLNALAAQKATIYPKHLKRSTSSINVSPQQCSKLSPITLDFNPVEELFQLAQRILETLEEWAVLASKSEALKSKIPAAKGISAISDMVSESEMGELKRQIELRAQTRQSSFSEFTADNTYDSYTADLTTKKSTSSSGQCELLCFIDRFVLWSRQLSHEITDFKVIIQQTKQETSIDLDYEIFFFSREPPKKSSRQQGKSHDYRLASGKKMKKRGSQREHNGPFGGFRFQQEQNKPKEKLPKQNRESCASCQVY